MGWGELQLGQEVQIRVERLGQEVQIRVERLGQEWEVEGQNKMGLEN